MLRASFLVLLTCACVPALAQNGRAQLSGNATACQEIADKTVENALPGDGVSRADKTAVAVRNKYALPATTTSSNPIPATSRGGGDDGDATSPALPRPRSPKWHSFLPGMFR